MTALAAEGGAPARTTPLPCWPVFDDAEIAAAGEVLASGQVNYWTGGHGRAFEREFAGAVGTLYAVAVANGTVALELALGSLGLGPGDEVIVPAATFIATASAVVRCGAKPVIADVDLHTQCLTRETVEPRLSPRTRAIVVVHLAGHPAELAPLLRLAAARDIRVVEDCAQAHGARYFGQPVGSFGDIAAWSFCQDKILTTAGEGGAITTSGLKLWRHCWEFKDHGKNVAELQRHERKPGFRWLHDSFGTNARMTEVQAAIGRLQLAKLDERVKHRRQNAGILLDAFRGHPAIRAEDPPAHVEHSYYRFYAHLRPERLRRGWDRDRVAAAITAEGIPCGYGGCAEIYRERAFAGIDGAPARLPVAAELGRTSLTLPVHPNLDADDMLDVARAVLKVLRVAA
ncbi:DegT/DnrJ/EryC1/StrS family aminotransferase [Amycolatopsis alkalitolerans]|uniref:DegT/DnrJ/EryC1/StrS aminotransferase family protein n=1 Tax=Amycolatopsis alkalitolerans TaxID=2547244 RepID=A0A5C4LUM6_9PSEU|nr:DegT/DnrJ/EryC1/StrS aminotransferase family protein [Amycolatopsis alkalitolerans]TNC21872.1 DegT/DnrJ/EryC1/StrS aminotransferase family protein [Amycolatopsis alkalitolerans]